MPIQASQKPIILASQSPRRSELLREAGIAFEACSPRYDEPEPGTWPGNAIDYVESVAMEKARSLAGTFPDRIILAADTTVSLDNKLFGKPADVEDARQILSTLFGTTHQVITGVALYHPATGHQLIRHATTQATMRAMSDAELDGYLAGGQWAGKAGAYGIQDEGDAFVTLIEGTFSNVVGLPIDLVLDMLAVFGIRPDSQ